MSSMEAGQKSKQSLFSLAEDCGRFFEVGFNIGILTYIQQQAGSFNYAYGDLYRNYLRQLSFPEMLKNAYSRHRFPAAVHKRRIARQWFLFFLQKGFLAGLNFMQEFHQSLHWDEDAGKMDIVYYQCSFCGDNSIYTINPTNEEEWTSVLAQLSSYGVNTSQINVQQYDDKGKFLHADTLMLLHYGTEWRILCVDLSIFSVLMKENMKDPEDMTVMFRLLQNELGYFKSKSVFSNLSIDTASTTEQFTFSSGLETYITAFKRKDKESAKLIQAGSYVHDFYEFLITHHVLDVDTPIHANIVGYTDRNVNAMSLGKENFDILKTCAKIYRWDPGDETIQDARARVLEMIRTNAACSFGLQGEDFTERLVNVAQDNDGIHWITPFEECIEGFANGWNVLPTDQVHPDILHMLGDEAIQRNINLLDAHKELVIRALDASSKIPFLFLTGNPGIGKTTAIVEFLKAHGEEGFLFFYVSPRKQVNLDIVRKFREDNGEGSLYGDVLALTTNSILIHDNGGKPTVIYYSPDPHGDQTRQGTRKPIDFLDAQAREYPAKHKRKRRLEALSEDRIWDRGEDASGVMSSICEALYVGLHDKLSNQLIATVAIQSLKKTAKDRDTLEHLEKIFNDMVTQRKKVIPDAMEKLAKRIKHIFIMIDEVTGDESGVAFLEGIERFIRRFELLKHGFNTKVIVADASIVDKRVIKQHLAESFYEPDKIYFCRVNEPHVPPLSQETGEYKGKPALIINANSYPAHRLRITYNVCIECAEYDENTFHATREHLIDALQQRLLTDIVALWKRPDTPQVIVYIQDKKRLTGLIEAIRSEIGFFELKTDYLEIHANISEVDKEEIKHYTEKVRVVFMTASASRGLSFPKTTYILIDVPRFEIEQNLMEIIQVIYRSRGNKEIDRQEKYLSFYLSDRAVYYEGDRDLSLRESILNMLNILLILKVSIMTRIQGYGQVGQQRLMMIPIGGKSVLAAGETYIGKIGRLITELRKESDRRSGPEYKLLKDTYVNLRNLLGHAELRVTNVAEKPPKNGVSQPLSERNTNTYLSQRTTFAAAFEDAVYNGFHKLLTWQPIELGYIAGSLLIVSMAQKKVQERYLLELGTKLRESKNGTLWHSLKRICVTSEYPDSVQSAAKDALDLIELLNQTSPEKIQQFSQDSQHADQYYALPLLTFMHESTMRKYFNNEREELEELPFKQLLVSYVRSFYPIADILPIGEFYRDFPFITFRSFSLKEVRSTIFSDNHLFISNEMNILNMLLSYKT